MPKSLIYRGVYFKIIKYRGVIKERWYAMHVFTGVRWVSRFCDTEIKAAKSYDVRRVDIGLEAVNFKLLTDDYSIHKVSKVLGVNVSQAKHIVFQIKLKPYRYNYNLYYKRSVIDKINLNPIYPIHKKPKKPYFEFSEITLESKMNGR